MSSINHFAHKLKCKLQAYAESGSLVCLKQKYATTFALVI